MCPLRVFVILLSLGIALVALLLSTFYNSENSNDSVLHKIIFDNAADVQTYWRQLIDFCNGKYLYNVYKRYRKHTSNTDNTDNTDTNTNNDTTTSDTVTEPIPTQAAQCPFAKLHSKFTNNNNSQNTANSGCPFSKVSTATQLAATTTA